MATASTTRTTVSGTMPRKITLSDFLKGSPNLPPRITVHGRAGVGKTEFAASSPEPIFLLSPSETGLQTLMDAGQVDPSIYSIECQEFSDLLGAIEFLRTEKHNRQTAVIDTINGMEKLANVQVCNSDYSGDMSAKGFMNYQAGYRTVSMGVWKQLLSALDRLRVERKMRILLLAHTGVANHKNPQGDDYMRWIPQFEGKAAWELTYGWSDIVLLADYEVETKKEGDRNAKAKAKGGDYRLFRCNWSAAYDAKNRYCLPDEIPMGSSGREAWQNLTEAIAASKTINTEGTK